MDKVISCVQINTQHSKAASVELSRRKDEIAFITEPHLANKKVTSLLSDRLQSQVLAAEGPHRPRAALRVCHDLQPWLVTEFTGPDMCVGSIKIKNQVVYVCSLYLDILKEVHHPEFLRLVEWCNRERMPLVIGMDSNAHSPLWGSDERNARGEELEDIFLAKNLTVMNAGSQPTFQTTRAKSVIDITVVNNMALQKLNLANWEVSTEASFSDHKYITFSLGNYVPKEERYRNLRKANWSLFQEKLDASILPIIKDDGSNLDQAAEVLKEQIDKVLEAACPWKTALRKSPVPW